ncbi:MAG: branched-chain amino acid ABC transporter permease [Candidatus Jordarchaeum sp.]|uniref:branched-chain amino acid ABC transporter permease n=1 Tax=Candidatus Jordarchaeum sp. TaxID=2823881 RepID=UPI00404B690C
MLLQGTITGLIMGGILSLPVLGVAVIYGITGIPNFAIGTIGVFGGFIIWYFFSMDVGTSIAIGVIICFVIGYFIQRILLTPISEKGGDSTLFFIITVSLGFVFEGLVRAIFPRPNISISLPRIGIINIADYKVEGFRIIALIFAVATLVFLRFMEEYTRWGKSWQATSQNLKLSKLVGINTNQVFSIASGLGCALSCIGAIFWGALYNLTVLSGWELGFMGFIIAVVGGIGNIWGGLISALIMGMVMSFSGFFLGGMWQSVVLYGIVILVLIIAPKGILGSERSL